jgi:hypothetical protein
MNILGLLTLIVLVTYIATSYPSADDRGAIEAVEKLHTPVLAVTKEGDQNHY